jgi:predicted MFS family arabinose efflux permease
MSGLLLGILLARGVSGLLTMAGTWRTVYFCGAAAMLLSAAVLRVALPRHDPSVDLSYVRLIRSIFVLFREEPVLRLRALLGAAGFATFSVLWTSMSFLLAGPPYGMSPGAIGLFGLAGAAGILAASWAGRLADQGQGGRATGGAWWILLLSWLPLAFAQRSLAAFVGGVLLLDLAVQGLHISNQAAIYRLNPEARSRLTSAYMTAYFIGGAAGSLFSSAAYTRFGWLGAVGVGLLFTILGGTVWVVARGTE